MENSKQTEATYIFVKRLLDDLNTKDWGEATFNKLKDGYLKGKATLELWNRYVLEREEKENEFSHLKPEELLKKAHEGICEVLDYYMDIPEDAKNIVALWIIGTYFHDGFETFPYLFVNAMRGSGKTRLLKIVTSLAKGGQLTTSLTESILFRTKGTLGLDEFESIGSKDKSALRELLNFGYKKGGLVFRNKKQKSAGGEEQVVESFEVYRPIVMANIWGMEEVLGDRCINILLEKSSDASKTQLIENFSSNEKLLYTKKLLIYTGSVESCRCIVLENIKQKWNDFIKRSTSIYTTTHTTQLYINIHTQEEELFKKIYELKVDGRNLELLLPLFFISHKISDTILENTLLYARKIVDEKRENEFTESKDVMVYSLVAKQESDTWTNVQDLTTILRLIVGEETSKDWLGSQWLGLSLKRLNLIKQKKRTNKGMQVILDVEKAKLKEQMFKPKEESK